MTKREWQYHDGKLCMLGYPIFIEKHNAAISPFVLHAEGRNLIHCQTLAMAKLDGERIAGEIDEFEPR